jgi:hypothetical protein
MCMVRDCWDPESNEDVEALIGKVREKATILNLTTCQTRIWPSSNI